MRGPNREGGLFLAQDKNFVQMVFCIPSALLPLKNQCYPFRKFIYISQLKYPHLHTNHQGQMVILEHLPSKLFPLGFLQKDQYSVGF